MAKHTKPRKGRKLTDLIVDRYVNLDHYYGKLAPANEHGCRLWTGVTNNIGYGFIGFRRIDPVTGGPLKGDAGMMTVHRLAYMIEHRRLPDLPNVNHTCHNKLCCTPEHLEQGTQQEKMQAMRVDGLYQERNTGPRGGYDHKQTGRVYKHTEEEIQWIRGATCKQISERFGLDIRRASAKRQACRDGYRWLPMPEGVSKRKYTRIKSAK